MYTAVNQLELSLFWNKHIVCMGKMACLFFLWYQSCSPPKSDDSFKQNENVMCKGNWKLTSIRMIRDFNEQAICYIQDSYRYYGKREETPLQLSLLLTYIINFPCIPGSWNSVKYCNNIELLKKKGYLFKVYQLY